MQKMRSLFFVLLMTIAVTGFSQMKIGVKTGDKFEIKTKVNISNSAEVMGQAMETLVDQKSNTAYTVGEITAEGINLQSALTDMKISATTMGQENNYDSDQDKNSGQFGEVFYPMINKWKNILIDHNGTIIKQDKDENDPAVAALTGAIGKNLESTDLFIPSLIGRQLNEGDSFPDSTNVKMETMSSSTTGIYTVTSVKKETATLSYTGTQIFSMTIEQMGMEMVQAGTNKITSEIEVDITTGLILEKTSVLESIMTVETMGMSIPASGKTTMSIKVSKK